MMKLLLHYFSATARLFMRAGALASLTVALLVPMHTAKADSWSSFCRQDKNKSLCIRGIGLCESGTTAELSCPKIKDIIMRYRGFSIAHIKTAKKDEERENRQKNSNR